jgi:hypothetical protein
VLASAVAGDGVGARARRFESEDPAIRRVAFFLWHVFIYFYFFVSGCNFLSPRVL